jgi:hypothetical protein
LVRRCGAAGESDARDAGEIGKEGDIEPAVEEAFDGLGLAEAEFEGEEAAGAEDVGGLGDEAAVDVEAVGAGEEGGGGFVIADFGGEGWAVVFGDVGRVGDDGVEGGGGEGGGEIGVEELDTAVESGVVAGGDAEGGGGEIRGDGLDSGFEGEGNADAAGAGSDIEDAHAGLEMGQGELDEEFCFRTRDEDAGFDAEVAAVELLAFGDVLGGLALEALMEIAAEVELGEIGELVCGVRDEVDTLAAEGVGEEDFGGEARGGEAAVAKKLYALRQGCL